MNKSRIAKVSIEQIGIDEDVLFNLMTHDAKYDFYALRPDEVIELQNSIKAIMDDRDRLRAINAKQLEALQIIAGNGCENYTTPKYGACIHARPSGRTAEYSAEAWCDQCVAFEVLTEIFPDRIDRRLDDDSRTTK